MASRVIMTLSSSYCRLQRRSGPLPTQQVEAFINQRREGAQPPPSAVKMGRFPRLASNRQVNLILLSMND
jgi:hypothetical protein